MISAAQTVMIGVAAPMSARFPRPVSLEAHSVTESDTAPTIDFDRLYRDYKRKIFATVQGIVGPSDDVEDVVQVAFLEIHRSLPAFQGKSRLSTWIYRIAVNVALQHLRKRKRRKVFLFFKDDPHELDVLSHDARPRYEDREVVARLYQFLDRLSEKKRLVFVLHELEGRSIEEVSEICEIPGNTVRSRLHAARTELLGRMQRAGLMEVEP